MQAYLAAPSRRAGVRCAGRNDRDTWERAPWTAFICIHSLSIWGVSQQSPRRGTLVAVQVGPRSDRTLAQEGLQPSRRRVLGWNPESEDCTGGTLTPARARRSIQQRSALGGRWRLSVSCPARACVLSTATTDAASASGKRPSPVIQIHSKAGEQYLKVHHTPSPE